MSSIVEELRRNKFETNMSFSDKLKKIGTIYQKKGILSRPTQKIETVKSEAEKRIDELKSEASKMRTKLEESRNYISHITSPDALTIHDVPKRFISVKPIHSKFESGSSVHMESINASRKP